MRVTRPRFDDQPPGSIELPAGVMRLTRGLGSELGFQRGGGAGALWAVGEHGPNLKAKTAGELYAVDLPDLPACAKIMPRPEVGLAMVEVVR